MGPPSTLLFKACVCKVDTNWQTLKGRPDTVFSAPSNSKMWGLVHAHEHKQAQSLRNASSPGLSQSTHTK
eukprot:1152452-Pelagomonas_calceolata.AAC.3